MSLVKEFYANMKGMIQRKVFLRRDWIKFDEVVNDAIGYPKLYCIKANMKLSVI